MEENDKIQNEYEPVLSEEPVLNKEPVSPVNEEKPEIGGWLAVFLWVGLGVGALVSLFNILPQIGLLTPVYVLVLLLIAGTIVTVAVSTIVAFIKRKPNAVALAKTYIAMIAFDAVLSFINYGLFDEQDALKPGLRSITWACIWFAYLCRSTRVAALIPKETRVWKGFEKLLLCVNMGANVILLGSIASVISQSLPAQVVYKDNALVTSGIDELQSDLPMCLEDGLYWDAAEVNGDDVVFTYRISDMYKSDYTSYELTLFRREVESNVVDAYEEWLVDPFMKAVFNEGYNMVVRYVDALHAELCEVRVTKEDMEAAL